MQNLISIILVEPENPDNIGAAARAMKNMGLRDLRLVKPPLDWKIKGKKMAMSAKDLLKRARVFKSLKEAVRDKNFVVGTTRRQGSKRRNFLAFKDFLQKVRTESGNLAFRCAVVFGKESKGLSNRDLAVCDWMMAIPSDRLYPSLNLAQAVMVVAAFLFIRRRSSPAYAKASAGLSFCEGGCVDKEEAADVIARFSQALPLLNYHPEVIKRIQATLNGLFKRGGLMRHEAKMFKGLARRILERINR